jgi:dynein heavy chain
VNNNKTQELEQKMIAKRKCYDRYKTYIVREIAINFVAPINNYWITYILDLIPHNL